MLYHNLNNESNFPILEPPMQSVAKVQSVRYFSSVDYNLQYLKFLSSILSSGILA